MNPKKRRTHRKERAGKTVKEGEGPSRITPGAAEGDLRTVEEDLKLQEKRRTK